MLKKQQDEWGLIINHQSELNRKREQEEKLRQQQEKEKYRLDLEQQMLIQKRKKEEDQRQREIEANLINSRVRAFQTEEEKKRNQDTMLYRSLAEEYLTQVNSSKHRQLNEKIGKLREEQETIRHNQALLDEEKRRKAFEREKLQQENHEMLQAKSSLERRKQEEARSQMLYDLELMKKNKEEIEKKERDYRDFYEKVKQDQTVKQNIYSRKVATLDQEKNFKIDSWVSKSVDQYQRFLDEKLDQEKRLKQMNLESVKETLRSQLEEKNKNEYLKAEEKRKNSDEVQRKIEENKRIEEERQRIRRLQQAEYFSHLSSQASEVNEIKTNALKLTDIEKRLNKHYSLDTGVGKNNLSLGAQEILKQNSRASSIFASPVDGASYKKNTLSSAIISKPFEKVLSPRVLS